MIDPQKIQNVLITRTDRIGDVILTLPLISEAKRIFKNAKTWFLTSGYVKDLLEGYEGIDELVFVESMPSTREKADFFKRNNIELIINAYPRPDISLAAFRAGVKYRVGTSTRWFSFLYNRRIKQHRSRCEKNEADYNLDLLAGIVEGVSYDKEYKFAFTTEEQGKVNLHLNIYGLYREDNYIIMHPGSGGSASDMPIDKFREMANRFAELYPGYKIVITGTHNESELAEELIINNNCINLAGKLNLRELAILINGCRLFLSNSTGPIHIAGALNKNVIGFYPNSKPINATRWGPPGENTYVFTPVDGSDKMNKIDINEVIEKVKEKLN